MDHSIRYWLKRWVREGYTETRTHGLAGAREGLLNVWRMVFLEANRQFIERIGNPGRPIYEPDWDVLVVLDACRTDLLAEVADEYEFLPDDGIGTFRSRGSKSDEWMARNFTPDYADEMIRTAHVTGNPYSRALDSEAFAVLDEVWRYAWDDDRRTIPARPITDRAIATWREREAHNADQMIVHYMQPHGPFVSAPGFGSGRRTAEEFGRKGGTLWHEAGYTVDADRVWAAYRENLRHALADVALLLDNLDAESVVLTADHGNAVGEFELWGHPPNLLLPCVREVPWIETAGRDTSAYEPSLDPDEAIKSDEAAVTERLRALGYAEE